MYTSVPFFVVQFPSDVIRLFSPVLFFVFHFFFLLNFRIPKSRSHAMVVVVVDVPYLDSNGMLFSLHFTTSTVWSLCLRFTMINSKWYWSVMRAATIVFVWRIWDNFWWFAHAASFVLSPVSIISVVLVAPCSYLRRMKVDGNGFDTKWERHWQSWSLNMHAAAGH